jgi:hypothetical protein
MPLPNGGPKYRAPNQGMHHSEQTDTLKNGIINGEGRWPPSNSELAIRYTNLFQKFVNSINFEGL